MNNPVPPPKSSELLNTATGFPPHPPLQQVTHPLPAHRSSRRRLPPLSDNSSKIIGTICGGIISVILAWGIYHLASTHFESLTDEMARKQDGKVENLERQISALNGQLGKARESIRSTASDLKERDTTLEDAKRDIENLKTEVGELAGANEKLTAEKTSLEESLADLGEELTETTVALQKEGQKQQTEGQKQSEPNTAIAAWRTWTIDMEEIKARFIRQRREEGKAYITVKLKSNGELRNCDESQLSEADLEFIDDNAYINQTRTADSTEMNVRSADSGGAAVDMSKARAFWLAGLRREEAGKYHSAASLYGRASRYMDEEDRAKALGVVKRVKAFGAARADAARQEFLNNIGRNTCGSLWMGPVYGWYGGGGHYIHIEHIISDPEPPPPKPFRG